jgi:hypothetical protein
MPLSETYEADYLDRLNRDSLATEFVRHLEVPDKPKDPK